MYSIIAVQGTKGLLGCDKHGLHNDMYTPRSRCADTICLLCHSLVVLSEALFDAIADLAEQLPARACTRCTVPAQHSKGCCGGAGNPKGVVLTHHTLVTAVASLQGFVDLGNIKMGPNDSFLSFLTLAHIFDRVVEEFMLSVGGHIGYWQVRRMLLHIITVIDRCSSQCWVDTRCVLT